jgi:hypothetical protein
LDFIVRILAALGVGIPCGLSPYLPLLVICVGAKGDKITLNPGFEFMSSTGVLIALAVLVGVHLLIDKIPQVENLYRSVNMLVCPIAGGLAAASTTSVDVMPATISFFIGLLAAEAMFLVSSGFRPAFVASSKMAELFESFISLLTDAASIVLAILALAIPVVGGPLSLLVLGLNFWWLRSLKRRAQTAKV